LQLGDTVILVAQGGPPEAEYALFDPGEIELLATEPGRIREIGYRTVVGRARARLTELGITLEAAQEAAAAMKPVVSRAYARGAAVRRIVDRLGPAEIFEGRAFDATAGRYAGSFMDLDLLARDLAAALPQAAALMQALHLAAALAERDDDVPVVLATAQVSAAGRPGERTYHRVTFNDPHGPQDPHEPRRLVAAMRALKPQERPGEESDPSRHDILTWARERGQQMPAARDRFAAIEAVLDARDAPVRGPLADGELWTLETKLTAGELGGVSERLDDFERRRGRLPGTMYLRARLALMTGSEDPRVIAERVSALSTSMAAFHELHLLAAQAWVAAGDARRARAFARDLLDNKTANDTLRMSALEVLDTVGQSSTNLEKAATPILPQAVVGVPPSGPPATPRDRPPSSPFPQRERAPSSPFTPRDRAPSSPFTPRDRTPSSSRTPRARLPSSPDMTPVPSSDPATPRSMTRPGWPGVHTPDVREARSESSELRGVARRRSLPPGASLPPYRIEARPDEPWTPTPPGPGAEAERVESLSLPPELRGSPPPADEVPRTPWEARLSFTYLARELAHELRVHHGIELRCDVEGLEVSQRYLREALADGRVRSPEDERQVMRHAGFLAEVLARRLGARWVDLEPAEPGAWAMLVPFRTRTTEVIRVWPLGRVLRFVAMGHKERDLVSYYLELEARAR
jgi:hypothetical protein